MYVILSRSKLTEFSNKTDRKTPSSWLEQTETCAPFKMSTFAASLCSTLFSRSKLSMESKTVETFGFCCRDKTGCLRNESPLLPDDFWIWRLDRFLIGCGNGGRTKNNRKCVLHWSLAWKTYLGSLLLVIYFIFYLTIFLVQPLGLGLTQWEQLPLARFRGLQPQPMHLPIICYYR